MDSEMDKTVMEYVSSVDEDAEILRYDVLGSMAHAIMLSEQGLLSKQHLKLVLRALKDVKIKRGAEDVHEMVESQVLKAAGKDAGGRMHTARSRNDQVVLDMRLKMRDDTMAICDLILDAAAELVCAAQKYHRFAMPLYTHLQQAQIGTLSHFLLAHADSLLRDYERFSECLGRINMSPLGAGAVGGTSLNINRKRTAELLGFDGLVDNSLDATSSRDFVIEFLADAAILMSSMSRFAEDVILWSSAEFDFVELPDKLTSPSSVMPQKKNPDIMELVRGKAAEVAGDLAGVLGTVKGMPSGYGRDLQQIKPSVWRSSKTARQTLGIVHLAAMGMSANRARMQGAVEDGHLIALDVAEALVKSDVPFRTAHKITGLLVRKAHQKGVKISGLPESDMRACAVGSGVTPAALAEIIGGITVSSSLEGRVSRGSAGYGQQLRMIESRMGKISKLRTHWHKRYDAIAGALNGLNRTVDRLSK